MTRRTIDLFREHRLYPDDYWYTYTTNQRLLRKYRLTSPAFLEVIDSLEPGFREFLHGLTKDIYDNWLDIDSEVERFLGEGYNVLSVKQIYLFIFWKMDHCWIGLPQPFVDYVLNHL